MKKEKPKRFILQVSGVELMRGSSINDIAKYLDITTSYIYVQYSKTNSTFKYKKVEYTIIDKLNY